MLAVDDQVKHPNQVESDNLMQVCTGILIFPGLKCQLPLTMIHFNPGKLYY